MITDFKNKTAVLTGAGSGFGLECARIGAQRGMNLVLVDVQQDALDRAAAELTAAGAAVLALKVDVSKAAEMDALAQQVRDRFGAPHFIFNNAGVGSGASRPTPSASACRSASNASGTTPARRAASDSAILPPQQKLMPLRRNRSAAPGRSAAIAVTVISGESRVMSVSGQGVAQAVA